MGLLRRHKDLDGTRYQLREKLFAIGDDYWIETEDGAAGLQGQRQGAARPRHVRARGRRPATSSLKIQEKKLSVRDKMEIERDGDTVATVKKALISASATASRSTSSDGDELEAKGNIVDHEYEIERDGDKVAEVSKRWFRVRDTYGDRDRAGAGRRADPRHHRLHRPDEPRLEPPPGIRSSAERVCSDVFGAGGVQIGMGRR